MTNFEILSNLRYFHIFQPLLPSHTRPVSVPCQFNCHNSLFNSSLQTQTTNFFIVSTSQTIHFGHLHSHRGPTPLPIFPTSQISALPQIKLDCISKSQKNLQFLFSDIVTVVQQKSLAFQHQITSKFLAAPSHTSLQSERSNSLANVLSLFPVISNLQPCPCP